MKVKFFKETNKEIVAIIPYITICYKNSKIVPNYLITFTFSFWIFNCAATFIIDKPKYNCYYCKHRVTENNSDYCCKDNHKILLTTNDGYIDFDVKKFICSGFTIKGVKDEN
jgi:hypothetical protein